MRVHRIDLYSNNREVARFDTDGPNRRNPYILKDVTGLDAEQITPRFYGQGTESGIDFTSLALEPREVVIKIGLQPDWSVGNTPGDLRGNLLKAIASNRKGTVQLRIYENEVVIGVLEGFITKNQSKISGKEPEVFITVKCKNPLIRSQDVVSMIVGSLVVDETKVVVDPISTAPHGFYMKMTFTDDNLGFVIQDPEDFPDWAFEIDYAFLDGDELYISSDDNNKYVYRVRSGGTLHLTDKLVLGSHWPIMFPGENRYFTGNDESYTFNEWYWYETHWGI